MSEARAKNAKIWERDPDDWYVEPSWVSKRLFETVDFVGKVVDPCCGMGNIVKSALSLGISAEGRDLRDRSQLIIDAGFTPPPNFSQQNFMDGEGYVDNVVFNPPFGLINEAPYPFIEHALDVARYSVAVMVQTMWVMGDKRSRWLETKPVRKVLLITPRPSMPPGRVILAGDKPGGGTQDYCWVIFERGYRGPRELGWLHKNG